MKLLRLEAENVFSIGHVLIRLNQRGLVLVTGYSTDDNSGNGAGKSSVANHAIVWGLYGQTYDGTRGDSVVNRNSNSKSGKVIIDFESSNGQTWKIVRTRNPNNLQLWSSGYREYDTSTITEQMTNCSHKLEKETQLQINHLLGRDFNTFIQADLLGPGTERSFFRLSGADQVGVIESLLPMSSLDRWAANAKNGSRQVAEGIEGLVMELNKLDGRLVAMREQRKSIDKQHNIWKANQNTKAFGIKVKIDNLKTKHAESESIIAGLSLEVDKLNASLPDKYKEGAGNLSAERAEVERKVGASKANIDRLSRALQLQECQTCGQKVADSHRQTLQKEYDNEYNLMKGLLAQSSQFEIYILCRKELKEKNDQILAAQALSVEKQIQGLQELHEQVTSECSPFAPEFDDLDRGIQEYDFRFLAKQLDLDKLREHKQWLEFWATGFSKDIKTMMVEEICPFLEIRINGYLRRLGNPQFKAKVSTVKSLKSGDIREKFNLEIQSDHGASSFDLLSVGEKQIVSFAASLAVSDLATTQVGGRSNILILDEPFMGLHKNNCDKIINFLNNSNVETILLISNEDNLKSMVPNRIHIVKTKGQSWLE